jgi:hypothetical protein
MRKIVLTLYTPDMPSDEELGDLESFPREAWEQDVFVATHEVTECDATESPEAQEAKEFFESLNVTRHKKGE